MPLSVERTGDRNVSQEINQLQEPVVVKVKRTRKPNALPRQTGKTFHAEGRLNDARYLERRFRISSDGGAQDF
jgi:hypothetical protein